MYLLIDSLESLQQETYKMLGYERNYTKQQQMKQQFLLKRVSHMCITINFEIVRICHFESLMGAHGYKFAKLKPYMQSNQIIILLLLMMIINK